MAPTILTDTPLLEAFEKVAGELSTEGQPIEGTVASIRVIVRPGGSGGRPDRGEEDGLICTIATDSQSGDYYRDRHINDFGLRNNFKASNPSHMEAVRQALELCATGHLCEMTFNAKDGTVKTGKVLPGELPTLWKQEVVNSTIGLMSVGKRSLAQVVDSVLGQHNLAATEAKTTEYSNGSELIRLTVEADSAPQRTYLSHGFSSALPFTADDSRVYRQLDEAGHTLSEGRSTGIILRTHDSGQMSVDMVDGLSQEGDSALNLYIEAHPPLDPVSEVLTSH